MKSPEALKSTADTAAAKNSADMAENTSASTTERRGDRSEDRTSNRSAEESAERKARKRVAQIKSFYSHLAVFLAVHTALVGVYLLSGGGHFWPLYSFFGWGIGLASHAGSTFDMLGMYGKSWEERKTREFMLQQEHGMSADEVKALLKREMKAERNVLPSANEVERMRQRLENLEAIVTSRDWDELPSHSAALLQHESKSPFAEDERKIEGSRTEDEDRHEAEPQDPAARAAQLAKRVR